MCQKELEADLSASKSDFLRAVADLSTVKEEKTRLEARICILESRDKHELGKEQKEKEELKVAEPPRPVVAAAKFTAPEPLQGKPDSKRNLRRSSRLHSICNKSYPVVVVQQRIQVKSIVCNPSFE